MSNSMSQDRLENVPKHSVIMAELRRKPKVYAGTRFGERTPWRGRSPRELRAAGRSKPLASVPDAHVEKTLEVEGPSLWAHI
jgi:hypothetical protein